MYESPINTVYGELETRLKQTFYETVASAVQSVGVNVNKDELVKALHYDREQYDKGRRDGEWEIFDLISSVWYGKQCYFQEDNGTIYSRISHVHMNLDDAIEEFMARCFSE